MLAIQHFHNSLAETLEQDDGGVPFHNTRIPALFFADDIAGLEGSILRATDFLDLLSEFCQCSRLSVNHSKCAVSLFNASPTLYAQAKSHPWVLSGKQIPFRDEYNYLGVKRSKSTHRW